MANWTEDKIVFHVDYDYPDRGVAKMNMRNFIAVVQAWRAERKNQTNEVDVYCSDLVNLIYRTMTPKDDISKADFEYRVSDEKKFDGFTTWLDSDDDGVEIESGLEYVLIRHGRSRWNFGAEAFYKLLDEYFPGVKMDYVCIEPGCEIYINTDKDGRWFGERTHFYLNYLNDVNEILDILKDETVKGMLKTGIADELKAWKDAGSCGKFTVSEDFREIIKDIPSLEMAFEYTSGESFYDPATDIEYFCKDIEDCYDLGDFEFTATMKKKIASTMASVHGSSDMTWLSEIIFEHDKSYKKIGKFLIDGCGFPADGDVKGLVSQLCSGNGAFGIAYFAEE